MLNSKFASVVFLLGAVAFAAFLVLVRPYSPASSIDLKYSRAEAVEIAVEFLNSQGFDVSKIYSDANLNLGANETIYLESQLGLPAGHEFVRTDSFATHYWDVYFFDKSLAPDQMPDQYRVRVAPTGRILGFQHILQDSIARESLSSEEALALAQQFLSQNEIELTLFDLENSSVEEFASRKDYKFQWLSQNKVYGLSTRIWLEVHGDRVGRFRNEAVIPDAYAKRTSQITTQVNFLVTASSTATFLLLIFIVSLFLKKYHDGEVGVKTALLIFGCLFTLIVIEYALRFTTIGYQTGVGNVNRFNTRIIVFIFTVFVVQLFMAVMVLAGWSVGESSSRQG